MRKYSFWLILGITGLGSVPLECWAQQPPLNVFTISRESQNVQNQEAQNRARQKALLLGKKAGLSATLLNRITTLALAPQRTLSVAANFKSPPAQTGNWGSRICNN